MVSSKFSVFTLLLNIVLQHKLRFVRRQIWNALLLKVLDELQSSDGYHLITASRSKFEKMHIASLIRSTFEMRLWKCRKSFKNIPLKTSIEIEFWETQLKIVNSCFTTTNIVFPEVIFFFTKTNEQFDNFLLVCLFVH